MKTIQATDSAFEKLVLRVSACRTCVRMCDSKRVLNRGCGSLDAEIIVVGEAPGRLGADASELPFHGDKAGHNFESLIEGAGLNRRDIFITNAVLCNPKDEDGNNSTPSPAEIKSCAAFLKEQIELINPKLVVTLGTTALRSISHIEAHDLQLRDSVRKSFSWFNRELVPLYHPGQRAMIHRSFANQRADYQYLAEQFSRNNKKRQVAGKAGGKTAALAEEILRRFGRVSYFALHKLAYLAEYEHMKRSGERLTSAYYVRQKDGPYCVELHPHRLKNAGSYIDFSISKRGSYTQLRNKGLFEPNSTRFVDTDIANVVDDVFNKYAGITDDRLKTIVYLTNPMRAILRREKEGSNQFNAPIVFKN